MKFFKTITIFVLSVLLLTACNSASFKEESKATIKTVETTFNEKPKEQNKKSGNIHFYLPTGYVIKDETPNNLILKNGADTYILFINPQEDTASDVVYKATVEQYKKLDTSKTYNSDNKFGFLTIKQLDKDDKNELTIGAGGAKITTQTKTSSLESDAKIMMEIVNSVEVKK